MPISPAVDNPPNSTPPPGAVNIPPAKLRSPPTKVMFLPVF